MQGLQELTNALLDGTIPDLLHPLPQIEGSQPPLKTPIAIISGTGKATNFKFCTHIHRIDRNKSPLKISGKVAAGVLRDSRNFQGTHIQGASRGPLCGSSAFLFCICNTNSAISNVYIIESKKIVLVLIKWPRSILVAVSASSTPLLLLLLSSV